MTGFYNFKNDCGSTKAYTKKTKKNAQSVFNIVLPTQYLRNATFGTSLEFQMRGEGVNQCG